jgi:hypothetical protein
MDTRDDSASEPAAPAVARRDGPDWGHLPHGETKVAKAIDLAHRAQVSNYLRASGLEVGLVMNFGSSVQFKRVVASPHLVRQATRDEDIQPSRPRKRFFGFEQQNRAPAGR